MGEIQWDNVAIASLGGGYDAVLARGINESERDVLHLIFRLGFCYGRVIPVELRAATASLVKKKHLTVFNLPCGEPRAC